MKTTTFATGLKLRDQQTALKFLATIRNQADVYVSLEHLNEDKDREHVQVLTMSFDSLPVVKAHADVHILHIEGHRTDETVTVIQVDFKGQLIQLFFLGADENAQPIELAPLKPERTYLRYRDITVTDDDIEVAKQLAKREAEMQEQELQERIQRRKAAKARRRKNAKARKKAIAKMQVVPVIKHNPNCHVITDCNKVIMINMQYSGLGYGYPRFFFQDGEQYGNLDITLGGRVFSMTEDNFNEWLSDATPTTKGEYANTMHNGRELINLVMELEKA